MSVASLHAHWYLFSLASTTDHVSSASTRLPYHVARCTGLAAHLYPTGCIPRPWCHRQSNNLSKQHYKTELSNPRTCNNSSLYLHSLHRKPARASQLLQCCAFEVLHALLNLNSAQSPRSCGRSRSTTWQCTGVGRDDVMT